MGTVLTYKNWIDFDMIRYVLSARPGDHINKSQIYHLNHEFLDSAGSILHAKRKNMEKPLLHLTAGGWVASRSQGL